MFQVLIQMNCIFFFAVHLCTSEHILAWSRLGYTSASCAIICMYFSLYVSFLIHLCISSAAKWLS